MCVCVCMGVHTSTPCVCVCLCMRAHVCCLCVCVCACVECVCVCVKRIDKWIEYGICLCISMFVSKFFMYAFEFNAKAVFKIVTLFSKMFVNL